MPRSRRWLLLTYAAALIAGSTAGYGQSPAQVDYGTSLRDGLAKERSRYSAITLRIGMERVDANAELRRAMNRCSGGPGSGEAIAKCHQDAQNQYRTRTQKINDTAIKEQAEHDKRVMEIEHKWWDYQPCTRPDCVNNVQGQGGNCSGGNCK